MKIRITAGSASTIASSVQEAGLALMSAFRDKIDEPMGKMSVARLIEYGRKAGVKVEKIDHSIRWVELERQEK